MGFCWNISPTRCSNSSLFWRNHWLERKNEKHTNGTSAHTFSFPIEDPAECNNILYELMNMEHPRISEVSFKNRNSLNVILLFASAFRWKFTSCNGNYSDNGKKVWKSFLWKKTTSESVRQVFEFILLIFHMRIEVLDAAVLKHSNTLHYLPPRRSSCEF